MFMERQAHCINKDKDTGLEHGSYFIYDSSSIKNNTILQITIEIWTNVVQKKMSNENLH
jgi:hypothetical protein